MNQYVVGVLFALGASLCWAMVAILLKHALFFIDSGSIIWFRMMIAALFLGLFLFIKKPKQLKAAFRNPSLPIIIAGCCLVANYISYMNGLDLTNVSNTQIMIQLAPILMILAGVFYFKERLSIRQWIGIITAGCGFILFYFHQIMYFIDNLQLYVHGNLWIILAALTLTLFSVIQKNFSQKYSPQQLNIFAFVLSAILSIAIADFSALLSLNLYQFFILTALGFGTLIAYGCLGEALKRIPASYVAFIIALDVVITLILMEVIHLLGLSIIEHEELYFYDYIGAVLVVIGIGCALLLKPNSKLKLKSGFLPSRK